ncbi:hypothetical protein DRQ36_02265 [bacterium]|nr:MAG: hypothetical protein DRQ36_02265 [bacterium]
MFFNNAFRRFRIGGWRDFCRPIKRQKIQRSKAKIVTTGKNDLLQNIGKITIIKRIFIWRRSYPLSPTAYNYKKWTI